MSSEKVKDGLGHVTFHSLMSSMCKVSCFLTREIMAFRKSRAMALALGFAKPPLLPGALDHLNRSMSKEKVCTEDS